jgi:hypothetical protein
MVAPLVLLRSVGPENSGSLAVQVISMTSAVWIALPVSRLFLTAVLAHTTSGLSTIDVDWWLLLLLRLLGVDDALLDVACEAEEGLLDVDVWLSADLHEGNAKLVGERLALLGGDCALLFPVTLVANEDLVDAFGRMLLDVREPGADVCGMRKNRLASVRWRGGWTAI